MPETILFIRLYLDADINMRLAGNLRQVGYDCLSAYEVGNGYLDDEAQLAFATNQGRALLTHNTQDFVPIFEDWWYAERDQAGVIVSSQLPIGELQRRVARLLNSIAADEMINNLRNLAEFAEKE